MERAFSCLLTSVSYLLLLSVCASAQEAVGAGKVEMSGFPGGGLFFVGGDDNLEVDFNVYTFGGSATYHLNRLMGIEGELGVGLGLGQDITYQNRVVRHVQVPTTWTYGANVVVYPGGNDRRLAGYVTGGAGGLTLQSRPSTRQFGLTAAESFFAGNLGGGVKIYQRDHWGYRIDYRILVVGSRETAVPFFAKTETRLGHRIYVGLLYSRN